VPCALRLLARGHTIGDEFCLELLQLAPMNAGAGLAGALCGFQLLQPNAWRVTKAACSLKGAMRALQRVIVMNLGSRRDNIDANLEHAPRYGLEERDHIVGNANVPFQAPRLYRHHSRN